MSALRDTTMAPAAFDGSYTLEDRNTRRRGRVFLTGTQALVRLPLMQRQLDRANGLNTAGFISGYRGSPLGGYDQALWQARQHLEAHDIRFQPALNEDLAATAVLGSQQVESDPDRTVDGVFAIWYGKGPGVDRAGDALKHGNAYGSSPHGGVLVVVGDDHGCVSSSMSHQSDHALAAWYIPVLHPANVAEMLEFGLYGFALSRFSGAWLGFKAISETVESGASVELAPLPSFRLPEDFTPPPGGLHLRWPDLPSPEIERRLVAKLEAVRAFARANPIDRLVWTAPRPRLGILTTGKAHLDLMEALRKLGITEARGRELGLVIYKAGLVWPAETEGLRRFAEGLEEVLVVEEKRPLLEAQLRELLYGLPDGRRPRVVGKTDEDGRPLLPAVDELRPSRIAPVLAQRLSRLDPGLSFDAALARMGVNEAPVAVPAGVRRTPYFCSGCPHNTSTRVPEGSKAFAGIGCHFMATWMDRRTETITQMGGEGVNWVGRAPFTGDGHVFQNLGDGTYQHSGALAIRQAIAAGVKITYKILFNDAVAMTGGQRHDGPLTVPAIAHQVRAEGVQRIAVVSDEPQKYGSDTVFPAGTTVHHRDELDAVQRELREVKGVSVLIYDQTCAAEKRRRRKRGRYPDPPRRVVINHRVCEGCGDCTRQSNCLSVVPRETEFGRKRQIDQSSCNKDFSCLKGFCPSFVTVEGGRLRRGRGLSLEEGEVAARLAVLPAPPARPLDRPFEILVTGVGGTGVVTVGALVTMAAHLEGKGASVLDFMGFAQKGGAVLSHVRLAAEPALLNQVRIDRSSADALLACDMVVATMPEALGVIRRNATRVVVNRDEVPTAEFLRDPKASLNADGRLASLRAAAGPEQVHTVHANRLATALMGDAITSNIFLLGYAWQLGLVPVGLEALNRAIELNGVAVEANRRAFAWGRLAAHDPAFVERCAGAEPEPLSQTLDELIARRVAFLTDYQNAAYARQYRDFVARVEQAEARLGGTARPLTEAVARNLFKLMAYKDEYEVARLYADGAFLKEVAARFEGDWKLTFHLAPSLLSRARDAEGRPKKMAFGPRMMAVFKVLARLRGLRGTPFDPFGWTEERRTERRLIAEYRATVEELLAGLTAGNRDLAVAIASLPDDIRGFGPVKQASLGRVKAREAELLAAFRTPQPLPQAAE